MRGRSLLAASLSLSLSMPALAAPAPSGAPTEHAAQAEQVPAEQGPAEGPAAPPKVDPANRKLVVAGNVVTGLGGAAFIVMAVGLLIHDNQPSGGGGDPDNPDEGLQEDDSLGVGAGLAIGGGAGAAALFTAGITLMAVGYRRERKRREALDLAVHPVFGPTEAGLVGRIRF